MGQIGGPSIWLHWSARFWLYIKYVRQSTTFFFTPEVTLAFFQNELLMSFSQCLPWSVLGILCSTLWTDGLKPFFIQDLVWIGHACVLLQHRVWEMKSLSAGGPGWQVFWVSGRQAGGGFSTLAGQNMDEWGWASVLMWISWPLWYSAEHFAMFAMASAHSFPRMPAWALTLQRWMVSLDGWMWCTMVSQRVEDAIS